MIREAKPVWARQLVFQRSLRPLMCVFLILPLAAFSQAFAAQPADKSRMATESEIRQHLRQAGSLENGADGYQYIEGQSTGYKISDGKICVKKRNTIDCADVLFDGNRIELIDRKGNREFMGN